MSVINCWISLGLRPVGDELEPSLLHFRHTRIKDFIIHDVRQTMNHFGGYKEVFVSDNKIVFYGKDKDGTLIAIVWLKQEINITKVIQEMKERK